MIRFRSLLNSLSTLSVYLKGFLRRYSAINYLQNPVLIFNGMLKVVYANTAFKSSDEITFNREKHIVGSSLQEVLNLSEENVNRLRHYIVSCQRSEGSSYYTEYTPQQHWMKVYKISRDRFLIELIDVKELSIVMNTNSMGISTDSQPWRTLSNDEAADNGFRFTEFFNAVDDLIYIIDTNLRILFMNEAIKSVFGDCTGEYCYRVFYESDKPCRLCKMNLVFAGKMVKYELYHEKLHTPYEVIHIPVKFDGLTCMASVMRDISKLKQLESQFIAERNYFKNIIDDSIDGFFMTDTTSKLLRFNRSFQNLFEIRNRQDLKLFDLVVGKSREHLIRNVRSVMKQKKYVKMELSCESHSAKHLLMSLNPLYAQDGTITGIYGFVKDISEIKRLQNIIEYERNYNRSIIETVDLGFVLVNDDNEYLDYNDAYLKILGRNEEELSAKTFYDFTVKEYINYQKSLMDELKRTGHSITFEKEFIRRDGSSIPVVVSMARLRDEEENQIGTFAFIRDISEQKEIENKLIERSTRILNLINIYNTISVQLLQCEEIDEVFYALHDSILSIVHPDSIEIITKEYNGFRTAFSHNAITRKDVLITAKLSLIIQKLIREQRSILISSIDTELNDEDLDLFPGLTDYQSALFVPIRLKDEVGGIVILSFTEHRDTIDEIILNILIGITNMAFLTIEKIKSKHEQTEMQNALDRYERLSLMGRIAAGVAHEINNPLSIMQLDLDELNSFYHSGDCPEIERRELFSSLQEEIKRMSGIVSQLKDYYRPDSFEKEVVSIDDMLKSYPIKILLKNLKKKGIELDMYLSAGKSFIHISKSRLIQVLMNIISNADDAIGNKKYGKVIIETKRIDKDGPYVQISIRDNGVGISSQEINRIFEPFYTTKKSEGTGLGLSISYSIIKNYNGEIEVMSEVKKGAEFIIYFPEHIVE